MRSLVTSIASSFALALALAACGGSSSSSPKPATAERHAMPEDMCPVAVPGTSVTAEDTERGAALVFTTTGDVAELRRRVNAMATMHNEHHMGGGTGSGDSAAAGGSDSGMEGMHAMHGGAGGAPPPGMMAMMHSHAVASDVESGARVELEASPGDEAAVQAAVREHAQAMASNGCEMHEMHEDGAEGGMHGDMHHHD